MSGTCACGMPNETISSSRCPECGTACCRSSSIEVAANIYRRWCATSLAKYRAAVDTRNRLDPDFVLIARTDAYGAVGGSMEEAIWRGRAYADAGGDLVWAELSNSSPEPAIQFAQAMRKTHPNLPLAFNYASSFKWNAMEDLAKNQEQAQWTLERTKAGYPTESHHVMACVSHFQELEQRFIPGSEDRIKGSHGFDDRRAH